MAASVREPRAVCNHSTAQLTEKKNNAQVSYRIQISNNKHSTSYVINLLVRCQTQQYCNGHNHTQKTM